MENELIALTDHDRQAKKKLLVGGMLEAGCFKLDGYYKFKFHEREDFSDYPRVPMYSNWREVQGIPQLRELTIDLLVDAIIQARLSFSYLSGVPMGGLWVSYGLCERLDVGHLLMRDGPKTHGIVAKIDGHYVDGSIVLPAEDVTTTCGSVLNHSLKLRESNLKVDTAISIQNYDLGATATLAQNGITLISALTLDDILLGAHEHGVSTAKVDEIIAYFEVLRPRFAQ